MKEKEGRENMGEMFEYKICDSQSVIRGSEKDWDYDSWGAVWDQHHVELFMNKLSKGKWDLVSVSSSSHSSFGVLVFKRLKNSI